MKLKTKLRKPKGKTKSLTPLTPPPYRVVFNRVNDSWFSGVKYAEIYPDWEWVHGEPLKTLYALTWTGLSKRVDKWLHQHQFDVSM
jgi:hypothetical protein